MLASRGGDRRSPPLSPLTPLELRPYSRARRFAFIGGGEDFAFIGVDEDFAFIRGGEDFAFIRGDGDLPSRGRGLAFAGAGLCFYSRGRGLAFIRGGGDLPSRGRDFVFIRGGGDLLLFGGAKWDGVPAHGAVPQNPQQGIGAAAPAG